MKKEAFSLLNNPNVRIQIFSRLADTPNHSSSHARWQESLQNFTLRPYQRQLRTLESSPLTSTPHRMQRHSVFFGLPQHIYSRTATVSKPMLRIVLE